MQSRFASGLAGSLITSIGVVFLGNAGASVCSFLSTVLVSKSLGPSGFGLTATSLAFYFLLLGLAEFGVSTSVVRFGAISDHNNVERLAAILKAGFVLRLITSVAVVIIGLGTAASLSQVLYHDAAHSSLILLASLCAAIYLLESFTEMSLRLHERFALLALYMLIPSFIRLLVTYLLDRTGHLTVATAIIAVGIGLAVAFLVGIPLLPLRLLGRVLSLHIGSVTRELLDFGKWVYAANIGVTVISRVDTLILSHYADSNQVGIYAAAFQLTIIFQVLLSSLGTVLLPQVTRLTKNQQIWHFVRIALLLALGTSLVMLALIPFAGQIVPLIFGARFAPATMIFRLLLVNYALQLYILPFTTIILARGRSRILAYQAILQLGISVICNFLLIPRYGAIGGAITLLLVTLVGGLWSIIASCRLMPYAAAQQTEDNHQVLAASE